MILFAIGGTTYGMAEETIVLVKHLGNYSEVKYIYEQRLTQIITKNNLVKYDD